MVAIEITYSRMRRLSRAAVTLILLAIGFALLFFTPSTRFPRVNEVLGGGGVAYAEAPSDSAAPSDSGCCGGGDSCGG